MKQLKEFFKGPTLLKCFVFSLFVSLLFTWRLTHTKAIDFFSFRTFQIYLSFTLIDFVVFMLLFLVLFLLSNRAAKS